MQGFTKLSTRADHTGGSMLQDALSAIGVPQFIDTNDGREKTVTRRLTGAEETIAQDAKDYAKDLRTALKAAAKLQGVSDLQVAIVKRDTDSHIGLAFQIGPDAPAEGAPAEDAPAE